MIFFVCLLCVLGLLLLEGWRLRRWRAGLIWRVQVHGSRGKSTATRALAAHLRAQGWRVVAKTTGDAPEWIGPDGQVEPVRRLGPARIMEHAALLRKAAQLGANVVVAEDMALQPETIWTSEEILRAHMALVTNTRPDHEESMGAGEAGVAATLAQLVPVPKAGGRPGGEPERRSGRQTGRQPGKAVFQLFCPDEAAAHLALHAAAKSAALRVVAAHGLEQPHELARAVARAIGDAPAAPASHAATTKAARLPEITGTPALSAATPPAAMTATDDGSAPAFRPTAAPASGRGAPKAADFLLPSAAAAAPASAFQTATLGREKAGNVLFYDLFSANDVTSSQLLWAARPAGFDAPAALRVALLATRADRPLRTRAFVDWLAGEPTFDRLVIVGDHGPYAVWRLAPMKRIMPSFFWLSRLWRGYVSRSGTCPRHVGGGQEGESLPLLKKTLFSAGPRLVWRPWLGPAALLAALQREAAGRPLCVAGFGNTHGAGLAWRRMFCEGH